MQRVIVQIDGGIGRCICAIPALEKIAEERELIVITAHQEVFFFNPKIYKIYGLNREYLFDDVIRHGEFFYPEPYWDHHFYQEKTHLISSFYSLLNREEAPENLKPMLYFSEEEKQDALAYIQTLRSQIGNRKIVAFQPYGATYNQKSDLDNTNRSLTRSSVEYILDNLDDDCCFVNFTNYDINHKAMCYDKFNLRKLLALLPYCDYLISVDSFLAHAGYGISIPGTQFMGGTSSVNFGYPHYYHTVQRKGFPKTYVAFRMAGVVEKNQDAMKFTDEELVVAVNEIKNRLKNEPDSCGKCSCQNVKKPRKITCLK